MFATDPLALDFTLIFRTIGLLGFAIYVVGFFCLSTGRMDSSGPLYFCSVLTAATFVLVSLLADFNLSAAMIQVFYIAMALGGIARRWRSNREVIAAE